jgi:prolyl-tRNA synthetase
MRWEMRPRMFLRTSEFLWQEGHTVFETEQEARQDALAMLQTYYDFMSNELALPIIPGEKTEEERFPGAQSTYTLETMTQDGKALQAGTSHYLGQSFSKAFDIHFVGRDNAHHTAHTASWGISTRLIGGIIMTHADDDGLILPPAIAPYHVVIIPLIHDVANAGTIHAYCHEIKAKLEQSNLRSVVDKSETTAPNKIWKWIKKGVPIRLEIGMKEVAEQTVTLGRRDKPKSDKLSLPLNQFDQIQTELDLFETTLRNRAIQMRDDRIKPVGSLNELDALFDSEFRGWALMSIQITNSTEFEAIAKKHALSRRCIPMEGFPDGSVFVAKSY